MPVSSSPHGIGEIINEINNEYIEKYGEKLIDSGGGSLSDTYITISTSKVSPSIKRELDISNIAGTGVGAVNYSPSGDYVYVADGDTQKLIQWPLSTAFDITTAGAYGSFDVFDNSLHSVAWNGDGTECYVICNFDSTNERVFVYSATTAYDVTTLSQVNDLPMNGTFQSINWNGDGTKFWSASPGGQKIQEFILSTAYDMTTKEKNGSYSLETDGYPQCVRFSKDADTVWVTNINSSNGDYTLQDYTLDASYDLSSMKLRDTIDMSELGNVEVIANTPQGKNGESKRMTFVRGSNPIATAEKEVMW